MMETGISRKGEDERSEGGMKEDKEGERGEEERKKRKDRNVVRTKRTIFSLITMFRTKEQR